MGGGPALLKLTWAWTGCGGTGPPSLRALEGGCVWVPGAVTSLQTLQTLGVFEVGAVTKALHGRYAGVTNANPKGAWRVFGWNRLERV